MAQGKKPPTKARAPRASLDPAALRAAAASLLDLAAEHEAQAGTLRVDVGTRVALVGGAGAGDGLAPPGGSAAHEELAKPSRALTEAVTAVLKAAEMRSAQRERDLLLAHADELRAVIDDAISRAVPVRARQQQDELPPKRELVVHRQWPKVCEQAAPGLARVVGACLGRRVEIGEVKAALHLVKPHHYDKGGVQGLAHVFAGAFSGAMRGETRVRQLSQGLAKGAGVQRPLVGLDRRARAFRYALLALGYDEERDDVASELVRHFWQTDLEIMFPPTGAGVSAGFDLVGQNIRAAGIALGDDATDLERLEAARLACITVGMDTEAAWAEVERWAAFDAGLRRALDEERARSRR